jgi:hypothetical protein
MAASAPPLILILILAALLLFGVGALLAFLLKQRR